MKVFVMQYFSPVKTKYLLNLKRTIAGVTILAIGIICTIAYSGTVHAGIISFMSNLWGSEQVSASITANSSINSQNIDLLQAHTNINPTTSSLADITPINNGEMLDADLAGANSANVEFPNTQISTYIVHEGDTLPSIAKLFSVSVNTIIWANNIQRTTPLKIGQTLIILPVTGINYKIEKGDTIKGIAHKYKADLDEILQYNDITLDSTLVIGQTIIIPDAEQPLVQIKYVARNYAHDTNGPSYSGYYIRPIIGGTKTQGLHGYNGVDLASYKGAPILASAAGTVIVSSGSGWNGGYGNLIIISHNNGTQTVYGHLSKNLVSPGQHVEQGERIGLMGATGKVTGLTGVHLHFEIRGARNPF